MELLIDHKNINLDQLNHMLKRTVSEQLGMEVVALGPDFMIMRMPVDHRTHQPHGVLNGGASMALAESVASFAGNLMVPKNKYCVGLEINGNHLKSIKEGWVYAKATPLHLGNKTQVWSIDITNEQQELICISRMTLAVLEKAINEK
jgi:1,4-dihydroxy-2-naphthoyl-CoA hydrolase